jgi:RNA polymerase sigma-70 factor (ECF subfamily)
VETEDAETIELLQRWHKGDALALDALVTRDLDWIRARVHVRLGPALRAREETDDVVQDALLELLRYGPRFLLKSRAHFRALLARIVENVLRDQSDRFQAYKRAGRKEVSLDNGGALTLDGPIATGTTPSKAAEDAEWRGLLRLGLELLDPSDREVVLLRQWDGLPFTAVATKLNVSEDAARMRFQRALARLAGIIEKLRSGRIRDLVGDGENR